MKKIILCIFFSLFSSMQISLADVCDNLSQYKLSNGQTVIVKEMRDNPIVVIDTFIKTGSVNENDTNNGVAHFLEHLFFKGTKNYKRGEFERIIESRGGIFNAATSRDYTHYYIKTDSKYFDEALNLHADMLLNVQIPQDELDMERKVVLEEIARSNDTPSRKLFNNFMRIVFNGNSYSREILGKESTIKSINREEILKFHEKWYTPENMITVVVGDVDAKTILPKIVKNFTLKHNRNIVDKIRKYHPNTESIIDNKIIVNDDVKIGYLILGYQTVGENNRKEAYALNLAASLLTDGQNSILYKTLKEKENLIIDASAGNYELKNKGVFFVNVTFAPENYDKLLTKLQEELINFKKTPIDEERLASIKNTLKRQYIYQNENISNLSNALGYSASVGNGIKSYCTYIDDIENITPDFIQKTINKYFIQDKLALSVILPNNQSKIFPTSVLTKISDKAKLITDKNGIKKYKLSNGATLLLQKSSNNKIIATQIFLKGGSLIEEKSGTASLLSNVITKSTKYKTGKELEKHLDNIGVNIDIDNDYEYFIVSMKNTTYDFENAFDLLKEIIEEPAFLQNDINMAKRDILLSIKANKDNPKNIAFENFYNTIHANSPFLKTSTMLEKSIPSIEKSDVENLHKQVFSAENMIISVVGDFDENKIIDKFSTLRQNKNARKISDKILKSKFSKLNENKLVSDSKNSQAAWLIQGWQTDGLSQNDFITLKLISTYLGSGFSSKLFVNLRENQGLAYEVGANSLSNFNSGVFYMYIGTNPDNIEKVKKEFQNEINLLKTSYISQEDLCHLKSMLIGRLKLSKETNMAKAYINGYYEFFDKGYQFSYDYPKLIENVSSQDILDIANKYFSRPYIISIVAKNKYTKEK